MTKSVECVSLDLWNTLFEPNPEYAIARTEYLSQEFNLPAAEVFIKYREAKKLADLISENGGIALNREDIYNMLAHIMGSCRNPFYIASRLEKLFFTYPPIVRNNVIDIINQLEEKDCSVRIISNTNFISGFTILHYLRTIKLQIAGIFSDIEGIAKPNPQIFERCYNNSFPKDKIIHIGDSARCDIRGATSYGIKSVLIEGPHKLYDVLKEIYDANL